MVARGLRRRKCGSFVAKERRRTGGVLISMKYRRPAAKVDRAAYAMLHAPTRRFGDGEGVAERWA